MGAPVLSDLSLQPGVASSYDITLGPPLIPRGYTSGSCLRVDAGHRESVGAGQTGHVIEPPEHSHGRTDGVAECAN